MVIRNLAFVTLLVIAQVPVRAATPPPAYNGAKFPYSAGVFTVLRPNTPNDPHLMGYLLDVDGDAQADVAELGSLSTNTEGIDKIFSAFPSPIDPLVAYVYYRAKNGGGLNILLFRRDGNNLWTRIAGPFRLPSELEAGASSGHDVNLMVPKYYFGGNHSQIASIRRLETGTDCLLVRSSTTATGGFSSRFVYLIDGSDEDGYADTWSDVVSLPGIEAVTLTRDGSVIAREIAAAVQPRLTKGFWKILILPCTTGEICTASILDSASFVPARSSVGASATGAGDVDEGIGAYVFAAPIGVLSLDSEHRPTEQLRYFETFQDGVVAPYFCHQLAARSDGSPVAFAYGPSMFLGLATWLDADFDGDIDNVAGAPQLEVVPVFDGGGFVGEPGVTNSAVSDLSSLGNDLGAAIDFVDFGEFPGGETFAFPLGSTAHDSLWVSPKGFVSFVGPIDVAASSASLAAARGIIAPAWSETWDTSDVEIATGYAPVAKSFATGERVLAFVVEWRGLRQAGWDESRSFSMRLILYSDGTFRTDYGPIGETDASFVAGYSGPGSHPATLDADLSTNSWGGLPAGTGGERVTSESFSDSNDLGHIAVRWRGYPERLDGPGVKPVVVNPVLKNGKLSLKASGSNIQPGARLVIDGGDAFPLVRNASGTKWTVKKNARSFPSNRTISTILAASGEHSIRVVNSDGETSGSVEVR